MKSKERNYLLQMWTDNYIDGYAHTYSETIEPLLEELKEFIVKERKNKNFSFKLYKLEDVTPALPEALYASE